LVTGDGNRSSTSISDPQSYLEGFGRIPEIKSIVDSTFLFIITYLPLLYTSLENDTSVAGIGQSTTIDASEILQECIHLILLEPNVIVVTIKVDPRTYLGNTPYSDKLKGTGLYQ
jgi:hypothetical protein